jgi:hypothetical protein
MASGETCRWVKISDCGFNAGEFVDDVDVFVAARGRKNCLNVHPRDGPGFHGVRQVQTFVPVGMVEEECVSILVAGGGYQGDSPEFGRGALVPGEDSRF